MINSSLETVMGRWFFVSKKPDWVGEEGDVVPNLDWGEWLFTGGYWTPLVLKTRKEIGEMLLDKLVGADYGISLSSDEENRWRVTVQGKDGVAYSGVGEKREDVIIDVVAGIDKLEDWGSKSGWGIGIMRGILPSGKE